MWFVIFICILFCSNFRQVLLILAIGAAVECYENYLDYNLHKERIYVLQQSSTSLNNALNKITLKYTENE